MFASPECAECLFRHPRRDPDLAADNSRHHLTQSVPGRSLSLYLSAAGLVGSWWTWMRSRTATLRRCLSGWSSIDRSSLGRSSLRRDSKSMAVGWSRTCPKVRPIWPKPASFPCARTSTSRFAHLTPGIESPPWRRIRWPGPKRPQDERPTRRTRTYRLFHATRFGA